MAKPIVSQRDKFCKPEDTTKLHSIIERSENYGMQHYCLFAAILKKSNKDATDFLKSMGCTGFIPHTYHIPLEKAAEFYGVSCEYLRGLLVRVGVNTTSVGNEYISADPAHYFRRAEMKNYGRFAPVSGPHSQTTYDFILNDSEEHYVLRTRRKMTQFISARIILGLAPLIAVRNGARERDHMSARVRDAVIARGFHLDKPVQKEETNVSLPIDSAEELLYRLIKRAVAEVLAGAKVEVPAIVKVNT